MTWQGSAHAQTHRAALLIQHSASWPGPRVLWKCVEFAQAAIGGLALLEMAGVNSGQPPQIYDWGGGAYTVCQVDRQPQTVPDRCFGPMSGPNWSDWSQTGNGWVARSTGVSGYAVRDGDVEAWTYSVGEGSRPPIVSFSQVCPPPRAPTVAPSAPRATPRSVVAATPAEPTASASPSPAILALAPSVSPSAGTALASTGPRTPPAAGGRGPWLLLGGALVVLTGLGAFNLRRRRP